MPISGHRTQDLVEHEIPHCGRDRRGQVEHARHPRGLPEPQQVEEQVVGPDGEDEDQPEKRKHELAGPVDDPRLQHQHQPEGNRRVDPLLQRCPGPQIHVGAETLLIDRPDREREHAGHAERHAEQRAFGQIDLAPDHHDDPDETEHEADPLHRAHPFAERASDDRRGQQGLKADDERERADRHPLVDRDEDRPEITAVDQHSGHDHMARFRRARRPRRPDGRGDRDQEQRPERETQREEGERLDIGHAVLGEDVARAPRHREYQRRGGEKQRMRGSAARHAPAFPRRVTRKTPRPEIANPASAAGPNASPKLR